MHLIRKNTCVNHSIEELMPLVTVGDSGEYEIKLPGFLLSEQIELEQMLNRVFSGRIENQANLALAQQLSINWCISKAKKNGLTETCRCR